MPEPLTKEEAERALERYVLSVSKRNAYVFIRRRAIAHALSALRRRHQKEYQALLNRETEEHREEYHRRERR